MQWLKKILDFGISQSIIHDTGTAFLIKNFVNWTKDLRNTSRPRTAHSPWTNGKLETQNQRVARYWRSFSNGSGTDWTSFAPRTAFAQYTTVNYTIARTPFALAIGAKPHIFMFVKKGFYTNKQKLC